MQFAIWFAKLTESQIKPRATKYTSLCIYQYLYLIEAGELSHVPERLEQILEEGGCHSDQVLVGLILFLVDAEQHNHSVCTALTLQQL